LVEPSAALSPTEVVEAQLEALQRGDVQTCFRFFSEAGQEEVGALRFELLMRQMPAYSPLISSERYAVLGALPLSEGRYRCRVRIWPRTYVLVAVWPGLSVLDYDWELSIDYDQGRWVVDSITPDGGVAWDAAEDDVETRDESPRAASDATEHGVGTRDASDATEEDLETRDASPRAAADATEGDVETRDESPRAADGTEDEDEP
jgi:hypothetical protein